jgi:hypothetical protein
VLGVPGGGHRQELCRERRPGSDNGGAVGDIYLKGLEANAANCAPLTPLVFLDWSADVYPDRLAVVHGRRRFTWA